MVYFKIIYQGGEGMEWGLLILFPWIVTTVWWYIALFYYYHHSQKTHKNTSTTRDFTIKILTLGREVEVLKTTVEHCINYCNKNPLIITKRKIQELSEANVKVVPEEFECEAKWKGRDLEWARINQPPENEYTLFLDEDSLPQFKEIPTDADIIQFQEVPIAQNLIIETIETFRIGLTIPEFSLYEKTSPLTLWGGGIVITKRLEDQITWNRESITEDNAFAFALISTSAKYRYKFSREKIITKAPLRIKDLLRQRWRWASGVINDLKYLHKKKIKAFIIVKLLSGTIYILLPLMILQGYIGIFPIIQAMICTGIGSAILKIPLKRTFILIILAPLAAYIHYLPSVIALLKRKKEFNATPKSC